MKLLFATHNAHKFEEVRDIFIANGMNQLELLSLTDLGDFEEIPEEGETLKENAWQKMSVVFERHAIDCFADDTGLEVKALEGQPGVHSARYAGLECRAEDNVAKLLKELKGQADRSARFRTVIALHLGGQEYYFEGEVKGEILEEPQGERGFGYDPIFLPKGYTQSFAQMPAEVKNSLSHRAKAIQQMISFFKERFS